MANWRTSLGFSGGPWATPVSWVPQDDPDAIEGSYNPQARPGGTDLIRQHFGIAWQILPIDMARGIPKAGAVQRLRAMQKRFAHLDYNADFRMPALNR